MMLEGTWRVAAFPSPWRGSVSHRLTPLRPTRTTASRKGPAACRCRKVRPDAFQLSLPKMSQSHGLCSSWAEAVLLKDQSVLSPLDVPDKKSSDAATSVVGTSLPLPVPNKPESVVSITSQCSYSSTIVHVGDKKPQPESGTNAVKTHSLPSWRSSCSCGSCIFT